MRWPTRSTRALPALAVRRGERLLAAAEGAAGAIGGTREALYLSGTRLPWEDVQAADWDDETSTLSVVEVGHWGEARVVHTATLDDPQLLLQLVRERVTASIVLQRHVPIEGRRGVRVIARRAPSGSTDLTWIYEYDEGIDPDDPSVQRLASAALSAAQAEVGLG